MLLPSSQAPQVSVHMLTTAQMLTSLWKRTSAQGRSSHAGGTVSNTELRPSRNMGGRRRDMPRRSWSWKTGLQPVKRSLATAARSRRLS